MANTISFSPTTNQARRIFREINELAQSKFEFVRLDKFSFHDAGCSISLLVKSPNDSPYEGKVFQMYIELSNKYPFEAPIIGICNMYHPNLNAKEEFNLKNDWSPSLNIQAIVLSMYALFTCVHHETSCVHNYQACVDYGIGNAEFVNAARKYYLEWQYDYSDDKAFAECLNKLNQLRQIQTC